MCDFIDAILSRVGKDSDYKYYCVDINLGWDELLNESH